MKRIILVFCSVFILFSLLSGCASNKTVNVVEYDEALMENIVSIQNWLNYINATFTEGDFGNDFDIVMDAAIEFRRQYQEENEVRYFVDFFVYKYLFTSQYLPTRFIAIKQTAENYVTSYNTRNSNKSTVKKLYEETIHFTQTINLFNEELREYGHVLIEFSDLAKKYNFKYP